MAMFEAPVAHEADHYSNPEASHYSNPEFEFEDELSHYSNPEASHYSNPYSNPEFEFEDELSHYSNPEASHYSNPYSNPELEGEEEISQILGEAGLGEYEDEADKFFGWIRRAIKKAARFVGPLAKKLAPFAARALAGMIPGVG